MRRSLLTSLTNLTSRNSRKSHEFNFEFDWNWNRFQNFAHQRLGLGLERQRRCASTSSCATNGRSNPSVQYAPLPLPTSSSHSFKRCYSINAGSSGCTTNTKPKLRIIRLDYLTKSIYEQLRLEEAFLRTDEHNYLILNKYPSKSPSIVMGISGNPTQWLNTEHCLKDGIPVMKRFTGGGTVIMDQNTLLITFIISKNDMINHNYMVNQYPKDIMNWTMSIYKQVFQLPNIRTFPSTSTELSSIPSTIASEELSVRIPEFIQNGNDYCFDQYKFGGNAQSITRTRFLHHTSFLWRYNPEYMERYLQIPIEKRQPEYRQSRSHKDFCCELENYYAHNSDHFYEQVIRACQTYFQCETMDVHGEYRQEMEQILERPHDKLLTYMDVEQELLKEANKNSKI
jgi:lipoate-protein ligase A